MKTAYSTMEVDSNKSLVIREMTAVEGCMHRQTCGEEELAAGTGMQVSCGRLPD